MDDLPDLPDYKIPDDSEGGMDVTHENGCVILIVGVRTEEGEQIDYHHLTPDTAMDLAKKMIECSILAEDRPHWADRCEGTA